MPSGDDTMADPSTTARFWRCALQVNPHGYIAYRGKAESLTPEAYNQALLEACITEKIYVIGIANHGNVDGIDAIRELMKKNGIVVFPGFEIASTEKIHFVCLFPEETPAQVLERYLGTLGVLDPADGAWPSNLGGNDLISTVAKLGGFVYAAHATNDSGILTKNLPHVWMNEALEAAQIPATLEEMKTDASNGMRLILENKNPDYRRERPVAVINAKDVDRPETLKEPRASCLVKMTRPCFESFKAAFKDPESRVRLVSELPPVHHSWIKAMRITGGYLDGASIQFSEHLNAVIGGRGTGKSTLVECLRFVLDHKPIGADAQKMHKGIIDANIGGRHRAHIEVDVCSAKMGGRCYTISRRYGESPSVKDDVGKSTTLKPADMLPTCEIYGQNEINEIAKNTEQQAQVLLRFLSGSEIDAVEQSIAEIGRKLADNRKRILDARKALGDVEDEVSKLPALEERQKQFKELGLEMKLGLVPLLAKEQQLADRVVQQEGPELDQAFRSVADVLPDPAFLSDAAIEGLPHKDTLRAMRETLQRLAGETRDLLKSWTEIYARYSQEQSKHLAALSAGIKTEEASLEKAYGQIPAAHGKTGRQIALEFQQLIKDIQAIRPKQAQLGTRLATIKALEQERAALLSELSKHRSRASSLVDQAIKKLKKKLDGKLRLAVVPESQRGPVIDYLLECGLEGIGSKKLEWIRTVPDFSPVRLVDLIRSGEDALRGAGWGITPSVAQALVKMDESQLLELQEIDMKAEPVIELNVSHGSKEDYKRLDQLSIGQKCTAILHLLLIENCDPLILDQPEDHLDNAFIADRIVTTLRQAKLQRQFVFATHNANIPVFGDAEWIGVLESNAENAAIPPGMQGAIDIPAIRDRAAEILEGGRESFTQRSKKYGYQ
jgi:ABC-type lipoprotein export system ATPase subunit